MPIFQPSMTKSSSSSRARGWRGRRESDSHNPSSAPQPPQPPQPRPPQAPHTKQSEYAQLQVEFRELTDKGFTPTPSPIPTPPQSDHGGEEGEACGEEGVPDVAVEHTSSDSGAAGDAARQVAGTARGGVLGRQMFSMR